MRAIAAFSATIVVVLCALGWHHFSATSANYAAWPPERATTLADLKTQPESQLFYPGATVWARMGLDEDTSLFGGSSAYAGGILLSSEPAQTVYAWYHNWLVAHRWTPGCSGPQYSGAWVSCAKYTRGTREWIIIAIDDPVKLGRGVPTGRTIVEARYMVLPYSQSK